MDFDDEIIQKLHKIRTGWKADKRLKCTIPQCCVNNFEPHMKKQYVQFFPYPNRESALHRRWCQAVRKFTKDTKWKPPHLINHICAKHFEDEDFRKGNEFLDNDGTRKFRLRLKEDAIPKIFGKEAARRNIDYLFDPINVDFEEDDEELKFEAMEHDHCYVEPNKDAPQPVAPKALKNVQPVQPKQESIWVEEGVTSVENMEWMTGGRSRITPYGVETDFIPTLEQEEGDSDLVVFLKQKVIFQQQIIRDLQRENQRAHIVMNSFLKKDQLKRLGFDPDAWS